MKRILLLIFSAILICSCNSKPEKEGFTLTGTFKNMPDSTMVYLEMDNSRKDSAMIIDEKFRFTGKVEEPSSAILILPETRDFIYVWLENSTIEMSAEKGNLQNPVITGSAVQKQADILDNKLLPFHKARDSARAANAEKDLSEKEQNSLYAYFDQLRTKEHEATQNFIKEHPNSFVSAYILNFYKTTWGKNTTEELYAELPEERRASSDGKMIDRFLQLYKGPGVGDQYEDFAMTNADGEEVRLSEIRKEYTLVHFWATHCLYSREENPTLVQNYNNFKESGFEILGVSIDGDRDLFLSSIEEDELPWNNLMSPAGKNNDAALIYGVSGTPENFLIDEEGTIIARNLRGEQLTQKLEELMPSKATAQL